jgi:cupin superfamily acireductone dioxygenase involved in methionine salvage
LDILSKIPFCEVQKEAIKMFLDEGNSSFVVYSFADISDASMALNAVESDAYCLQFVPDKLMTVDLCKIALQHPEKDKKVLEFIPEKFHNNPEVRKIADEKFGHYLPKNEKSLPNKRKGRSI